MATQSGAKRSFSQWSFSFSPGHPSRPQTGLYAAQSKCVGNSELGTRTRLLIDDSAKSNIESSAGVPSCFRLADIAESVEVARGCPLWSVFRKRNQQLLTQ